MGSRQTYQFILYVVFSLMVLSQLGRSMNVYLASSSQTVGPIFCGENVSKTTAPRGHDGDILTIVNEDSLPEKPSIESVPSTPANLQLLETAAAAAAGGGGRNLVAFTALGLESAIPTVHFNVLHHFQDWDCIVYIHSRHIQSNETRVQEISRRCTLVTLPGTMWTHFLMTLTPELTRGYDHVAVVLDDVFAPSAGRQSVNVTRLLQHMQEHALSSISPAIKGGYWSSTKPRGKKCLFQCQVLETFFQIFRRDLFQCWRGHMEHSNPQGTCLDLCLEEALCPEIANGTMAVDSSMVAYHLGRQHIVHQFVPQENLVNANLSYGMRRDYVPVELNMEVCKRLQCPTKDDEVRKPKLLECHSL